VQRLHGHHLRHWLQRHHLDHHRRRLDRLDHPLQALPRLRGLQGLGQCYR